MKSQMQGWVWRGEGEQGGRKEEGIEGGTREGRGRGRGREVR